MSKAILVIDMPSCCNECPICASYAESAFSIREYWCTASDNTDVDPYDKPKWCPLKPVPEKIDVPDFDDTVKAESENAFEVGMYMYDRGHYRGYNLCIDKILNT